MARKLKSYWTSLGFYDLAIAAPSMKAALDAWGAGSNLFHQGVANESNDPGVVAATISKPGVVLRRPVGTDQPFREHSHLPTHLSADSPRKTFAKSGKKRVPRTIDHKASDKAAVAFDKEQRRRDDHRRKEEAARERERQRRNRAIAKAQAELEKSEREHHRRAATIEATREVLDKKSRAEDARWAKEKERLESSLRRAQE